MSFTLVLRLFTSVYVGHDGLSGTLFYVSLRRFTSVDRDVELDNCVHGHKLLTFFGECNFGFKFCRILPKVCNGISD